MLLDVRMPGIDGVETLRRIRALSEDVASTGSDDPWHDLAHDVFQAARGMRAVGRTSTGERLEAAVLAAVREAASGQRDAAAATLAQVGLLLNLAADLRDLTGAELASVQTAIERARQALTGPRPRGRV